MTCVFRQCRTVVAPSFAFDFYTGHLRWFLVSRIGFLDLFRDLVFAFSNLCGHVFRLGPYPAETFSRIACLQGACGVLHQFSVLAVW
jgi:hypothetical protein